MESSNTFARDYRAMFAATQPARSRLLAATGAAARGTALPFAGIAIPAVKQRDARILDPKHMIPTADSGWFRSWRPPV